MWGNNIRKEDMFKRHISQWPGSRSTNYVMAGGNLQFKEFPYLKIISWAPCIYAATWAVFSKN
jgi:hypothetical protein